MADKIVMIGQAPSRGRSRKEPLTGASGKRLAQLAGLSTQEFRGFFDRANVLRRWPGKNGKGDAFPAAKARRGAVRLRRELAGRRLILLGSAVARAFGLRDHPLMTWFEHGGLTVAVIPHPSGLNRWWNDSSNTVEAAAFLGDLID